jgi:hypothetical protein
MTEKDRKGPKRTENADTGRIYIKGYIYISYPISKNLQKGYFLSFFGAGYFEDIISLF